MQTLVPLWQDNQQTHPPHHHAPPPLPLSLSLLSLSSEEMKEKPELSTQATITDDDEDGGGDEEFYEKIEAPKFVDFTAPDPYRPDDRYWFCLRVGEFLDFHPQIVLVHSISPDLLGFFHIDFWFGSCVPWSELWFRV